MAKRESTYTQRSFFSRGKAWSVDARRPFVSGASRTRNALASHRHRSRLPLTGRIAPRLYLSFSLSRSHSISIPIYLFLSVHFTRAYSPTRTPSHDDAHEPPLVPMAPALPTFQNGILAQQEQNYNISVDALRGTWKNEENDCSNSKLDGECRVRYLFHTR